MRSPSRSYVHLGAAKFQVFESGKVPFLGLSSLGCYRDLYMLSSALLIKLYVLFWDLLRDKPQHAEKPGADMDSPGPRRRGMPNEAS